MNYNEFCEYMKESMESRLSSEGEYYIFLKGFKKNNDTPCKALVINKPGREGEYSISPCIHLEPFWDEYTENPSSASLIQVVDQLYDSYKNSMNNMPDVCKDSNMAAIRDYEKIKDSIVPCVVNSKWNQETLADVPHKNLSDFTVLYRIMFDDKMEASAVVNNKIMKSWGVSQEDIHEAALSNMESKMRPLTKNMYDVLADMMGIPKDELPVVDGPELYVVGNELGMYGASILADTDYLKSVSKELGGDYVIIPSSVHEIICLKYEEEYSVEQIQDMIETVNATEVDERERLSDVPYVFDSTSCEVVRMSDFKMNKEAETEVSTYNYAATVSR